VGGHRGSKAAPGITSKLNNERLGVRGPTDPTQNPNQQRKAETKANNAKQTNEAGNGKKQTKTNQNLHPCEITLPPLSSSLSGLLSKYDAEAYPAHPKAPRSLVVP
jgi:hypothetical protein